MPSYTVGFREEIIRKILSVDRVDSMKTISKNISVPVRTIRRWVKRRREVVLANTTLGKHDKMNSVLSTINLPFEDKSVYCRKNGIMPEELEE